jgi:hypothetical protein
MNFLDNLHCDNNISDSDLVSAISYHLPFAGAGLLLVMNDENHNVTEKVKQHRSQKYGDLIWLRRSELWQLSIPNPYAIQSFSLPYWIREEGTVEFGEDVRCLIPYLRETRSFLACHIEFSLLWLRSKLILSFLATHQYARLRNGLARERALLMQSALLAKKIWRVTPENIKECFLEAYPDLEFHSILTALHFTEQNSAVDSKSRGLAFELVWLHERFVHELQKHIL